MIYYFTPYCPDKRLGHIHNRYCELVKNPEDWICMCDPDILFLTPETQARIAYIVETYGNKWDVLGCMTNRLGTSGQIICEDLFSEPDINAHINRARYVFNESGFHIRETSGVAGMLMLFKRKLWDRIKFEEGINFDIRFCEAVKNSGGAIGIMKGIYVFHLYRWGKPNPKSYKRHLLK